MTESRPAALTVDQVADLVQLSPSMIRKLIAAGSLARVPNTGRKIRIATTEVERAFQLEIGAAA